MSWSASFTAVEKDQIDNLPAPNFYNAVEEAAEQFESAKTAAAAIAGTIGVDSDRVNISMSGHSNDGHVNPAEGWAPEALTVSVSWAQPPVDTTAPEA